MGIKVDTQQQTTTSNRDFPYIRTVQQAEREGIVERFDNITATNVPFTMRAIDALTVNVGGKNVYLLKDDTLTIEPPIDIMPPIFGVEALKAHMRELKAFMEDNYHEHIE